MGNDHGTSHFSIVDEHRNAVAMTTTVNTIFGCGVVSQGVLLNSDMDDFSSPNVTNMFGLYPSEANYIQPRKRPLSSMSPTLVFYSGRLFMVLGASGGPKIITATLQSFINHALLGMPLFQAVSAPRLHNQLLYQGQPITVYDHTSVNGVTIELNNLTKQALRKRGQILSPIGYLGTVQAIAIDLENDTLTAVSDIRKMGSPAGY